MQGFGHVQSFCIQSMTANAKVATVLGLIPASSDTVEYEERQMKQCLIQYIVRYISKFPKEQIGVDYTVYSTVYSWLIFVGN